MRLPRNLSGGELITALGRLGYEQTRQRGSHVRLTTLQNGRHDVTVPLHESLRVGTLSSILRDVGGHFGISRDDLMIRLFG